MDKKIENYRKFFLDQVQDMQRKYRKLRSTKVRQLVQDEHVFVAIVDRVREENGLVVMRFDCGHVPRLRVRCSFVLVTRRAREHFGDDIANWQCTFNDFISGQEYCTGASCGLPVCYIGDGGPSRQVGFSGVSLAMFTRIKNELSIGTRIRVFLYEPEPPTDYLLNLSEFAKHHFNDPLMLAEPTKEYDQWTPQPLSYDAAHPGAIANAISTALDVNDSVALQGPPGTGKSYTIAQIVAKYISQDRNVCVTAMANEGLMELITQEPLKDHLAKGRLSKTLLTIDEKACAKGLRDANTDLLVGNGSALFATNYQLSKLFPKIGINEVEARYDLIVVEEASQAYLTTIAACMKLGQRVLVVGDPMQLPPIVKSQKKEEYKKWGVDVQVNGMLTYILGTDVKSFRIVTTFRLPPKTAAITGVFYGDSLKSVSPGAPKFEADGDARFPCGGGVVFEKCDGPNNTVLSDSAIRAMDAVLSKIESEHTKRSLTIITPFVDSVKAIQRQFANRIKRTEFSVETIDRVQGATVDYAIVYFPLNNVPFSLNQSRFNVATSRSRGVTLILSDYNPLGMTSITGKVREYFRRICPPEILKTEDLGGSKLKNNQEILPHKVTAKISIPGAEEELLRLQSAMNSLQVKLMEWIKGWLPIIYPTNTWRDGVVRKLSALQYNAIKANGVMSVDGLDLNELLSVFIGSFREFQSASHIAQELQTLAFHIRDIRHVNAHRRTNEIVNVDVKDIKYHIDTIDRFLAGLDKAVKPESIKPKITVTSG